MTQTIAMLMLMLAAAAALGAETPKAGAAKKPPAAKAAPKAPTAAEPRAPKAVTVPEGAVEIERGTWRHVDSEGKAWRYRRTPFGLVKFAEEDAMPDAEPVADLAAVDKGDTVEFQRRTPFGVSKWTRKKDELDANEKAALERSRRANSSASGKAAQE